MAPDREREAFTRYGQDKVKQRGASIAPYYGWEERKLDIMETLQREKFLRHPDLLLKLLTTGNEKLIVGNNKKDKFWGVNLIIWEGENHLGNILMKIRDELRQEAQNEI